MIKAKKENNIDLPYNYWRKNQKDRYNNTIFDFRVPRTRPTEAYIVDGIMGYGKTTAAINFINDQPDFIKFIYITPYLKEIERIKLNCPSRNFVTPEPKNKNGSKMNSLMKLLEQGKNIIATHALFKNLSEASIEYIKMNNYILIMDEVADVIEKSSMTKEDIKFLLALDDNCKPVKDKKPIVRINEDNVMEWIRYDYKGKLEEYKVMVELGCLVGYGSQDNNGEENFDEEEMIEYDFFHDEFSSEEEYNEAKEETLIGKIAKVKCPSMMMWNYPASIYKTFYKIFILTYMFEGQMQCGYYKLNKIPYKYIKVKQEEIKIINNKGEEEIKTDYNFIPELCDKPQEFDTTKYQQLIHIEERQEYNSIGAKDNSDKKSPLSKSWYNNSDYLFNTLRRFTYNFFTHAHRNVEAEYRMWTTFKTYKKNIQDKGYTKNFVELNARATNDYKNKYILAYLVDRYPVTPVLNFLQSHGVTIDIDQFALSEMLQWIFRSRIRDNKEIWIYVPSSRMRNLLKQWMGLEPENNW